MTTPTVKASLVHAVREKLAAGMSEIAACKAVGVHRCSYRRWADRFDLGGVEALHDGITSGRPPIVTLTPPEAEELRRMYIKSNLREGAGSISGAARLAARDPATCLSPETRAAILAPRSSKHALPVEVRRACRAAPATVRHYRDADAIRLGGIHAAGLMRMVREPSGELRRLLPGERQSWDDGSINFLVCVPWPRGGDKCAERYGVRVARFQLLAGIDDATDFCPGWNYIMRMQDSYRAQDVCATLHGVWGQTYVPRYIVLEGGAWQAHRTIEFVEATGAAWIDAKGRPRGKLIEGWWNRLWTVLSTRTNGQIGRYRGEMTRESDLWMKCQAGTLDPRQHFPALATALEAMEWSVGFLNADQIESKEYGRWIPIEAHAAGVAAMRRALPTGLDHFAARELHARTVRRDGMLGATAMSPLGYNYGYIFQADTLLAYEGARVNLYFDPWLAPVRATVSLAAPWRDTPAGTIITRQAVCLNAAPEIIRSAGQCSVLFGDAVLAAKQARARAHAYVRHEQRSLANDGHTISRITRDNVQSSLSLVGTDTACRVPEAPSPDLLELATDFDALEAAAGVAVKSA